ncbi:unnamed protein product [Blepharisma stoltei]|uniref:DNA sliding clamp PCNA n=1 Tax=Blepharisma stoltei TaxID=1481888 RepID=A0AAU9IDC6_9CILI|nr:unnamed protein product [Blepharisma stoltei]
MFEALISKAADLKRIIEALKEMINEGNVKIDSEGISLQAMDASHVALIVLNMEATNFEEFRCDHRKTLGIPIQNLWKMMRIAGADDSIRLIADDTCTKLKIVSENSAGKVGDFDLNLIILPEEQLEMQDIDHICEITMESSEFARICRELAVISDELAIIATKERIVFEVNGDAGKGQICCNNGNCISKEQVLIDCKGSVQGSYALRYINQFNKAALLGDRVFIKMAPDLPISFTFPFSLGSITYFLAPKLPEDVSNIVS